MNAANINAESMAVTDSRMEKGAVKKREFFHSSFWELGKNAQNGQDEQLQGFAL